MEKYLYYSTSESNVDSAFLLKDPSEELHVKVTKISPFRNTHSMVWKFSSLFGGGLFVEYQLLKNGVVVCDSEVTNWMLSFPFMSRRGIYIGSCRTKLEERGRGYYPYLIAKIKETLPNRDYYMFVDEGNHASIRGVEKAGFYRYATLRKTRLGLYLIKEKLSVKSDLK